MPGPTSTEAPQPTPTPPPVETPPPPSTPLPVSDSTGSGPMDPHDTNPFEYPKR